MTFLQAAEVILREARRPLTATAITRAALERGLIDTHGRTPRATMSARLYEAPADGPIQREFTPGERRAARGSVRWVYAGTKR